MAIKEPSPVRRSFNGAQRKGSTEKLPQEKGCKERSLFQQAKRFAVKNTWAVPLAIICLFISLYMVNPTESNIIHRFLCLSYKLPSATLGEPVQYGKGPRDIAFVAFFTVVLTFAREFTMQRILDPLARRCHLTKAEQPRFKEQSYTALYVAFIGPLGLYVMRRSPVWYFNTAAMYANFPHTTHEGAFKFYYLFQAAFWAQQALVMVLGLEKRRRDFRQLVAHHIITLALIALSYRFHFTYMGIAVYITHDISDFFLATSKICNYLDSSITVPYFAIFASIWIYLRHYLNIRIIYSLFTEFRTVGPYELDWATEQYKCPISLAISATLLILLQCLNIFWLFCILRVAYRIAMENDRRDDRSDDEESDGE